MSDYGDIMDSIMAGDIDALKEFALLVDDFPTGKDDFIGRYWLTNGIDCGTCEVVSWMLENGSQIVFRDDEGYTPLHSAIEAEKHDVVKLLIDSGAAIDGRGTNDWTPAHHAAAYNDVKSLKLLKNAGADFTIRTRIDEYATPLEEAEILGRSPEAVAYLRSTEQEYEGDI